MHDGEPHSRQRHVRAFWQPAPQFGAVVVAPARHQPLGARFERVEQLRFDPVAGVHHHVGGVHFVPDPCGKIAGALGNVGIGDEQQPHRPNLAARPRLPSGRRVLADSTIDGLAKESACPVCCRIRHPVPTPG